MKKNAELGESEDIDAFENAFLSALQNLSDTSRLVYDKSPYESENTIYTINETYYSIIEENQYRSFLLTLIKTEFRTFVLMLMVLVSASYVFVNRSIKTLGNLITDLDRNYRKNTTGSCLITEYHLIISRFEDIKLDINNNDKLSYKLSEKYSIEKLNLALDKIKLDTKYLYQNMHLNKRCSIEGILYELC